MEQERGYCSVMFKNVELFSHRCLYGDLGDHIEKFRNNLHPEEKKGKHTNKQKKSNKFGVVNLLCMIKYFFISLCSD